MTITWQLHKGHVTHAHACVDESHDSIGRHYIGGTEQIRDEYLEYELSQHGRQNLEE